MPKGDGPSPAVCPPIHPKTCLKKGTCSRMVATAPSIGPGMPAPVQHPGQLPKWLALSRCCSPQATCACQWLPGTCQGCKYRRSAACCCPDRARWFMKSAGTSYRTARSAAFGMTPREGITEGADVCELGPRGMLCMYNLACLGRGEHSSHALLLSAR